MQNNETFYRLLNAEHYRRIWWLKIGQLSDKDLENPIQGLIDSFGNLMGPGIKDYNIKSEWLNCKNQEEATVFWDTYWFSCSRV